MTNLGFSSPQKADSKKLQAELEREVQVKRLSNGQILTVTVSQAYELLIRKPVEFVEVDDVVPSVNATSAPTAQTAPEPLSVPKE